MGNEYFSLTKHFTSRVFGLTYAISLDEVIWKMNLQ